MQLSSLNKLFLTLSLAGMILFLAHCGTTNDTTTATGTFTAVYTQTLKTACITCHVPTGIAPLLDFTTQATAYQALTAGTVQGAASGASCRGLKIVSPSAPSSSYLVAMLVTSYRVNNFGGASGCLPLNTHDGTYGVTSAELTSLVTWVQNGALNN